MKQLLISWFNSKFGNLLLLSISLIISLFGAGHLIENNYFDKLLYQKSWLHGYYYKQEYPGWLSLLGIVNTSGFRDHELKEKQVNEYLILVVGDSNVWGVGVRQSQRFTNKLERMLSKFKKTRVISLGRGGTNLSDHMIEAYEYEQKLKPDLVVFTFYENDLIIYPYQLEEINKYKFINTKTIVSNYKESLEEYYGQVLGSYDERTLNFELFKIFASKLNKNYLYYILNYSETKPHEMLAEKELKHNGLNVINNQALYGNKYKYFATINNQKQIASLTISAKEGHPNNVAHDMFAERLYQEITKNKKYGFTQ